MMFKYYFIIKSISGKFLDNSVSKEFDLLNEDKYNSVFHYEFKKKN